MKIVLMIGAGSFISGILLYLLSQFIMIRFLSIFSPGTLVVNIIGCFLIGILFGLDERNNMTQEWKFFLATGLLGGFNTFSAFSIETIFMLREGQPLNAATYIVSSVLLGLLATWFGMSMVKAL